MPEKNQPQEYYIPTNITDNGYVFGKATSRNVAEMVAILAAGVLIAFGLLAFLPFKVRLIVFFFFLMLEPLAYFGFRDEPFIEHFIAYIFFIKKKRTMKYRLPREDKPAAEKKSKKKKGKDNEEQVQ